jgi:hypothetical protein
MKGPVDLSGDPTPALSAVSVRFDRAALAHRPGALCHRPWRDEILVGAALD